MERMSAPHRSRAYRLVGLCFGLVFIIAGVYFLWHRVTAFAGAMSLWASLLVYWVWFEGWRKFLKETAPGLAIFLFMLSLAERVAPLTSGFAGFFSNAIALWIAMFLHSSYLKLIGARSEVQGAIGPSPAEIWSDFKADYRARRAAAPRWSVPRIRTTRVKSPDLSGVVEYDSMRFPSMKVEECSADWAPLSEAKTDDDGYFALPPATEGPVHFVRVSWPGAKTAHLHVELSPDARPLLIRLKQAPFTGHW